MFYNLSKICEASHQDVYNMLPVTFVIDLGNTLCQNEFDRFCYYFNTIEKNKPLYEAAANDEEKA